MHFHVFVIPFTIGAIALFGIVIYKFILWMNRLDRKQKFFVRKNFISFKTIAAIGEVFKEALFHKNIYKNNFLLGYMHMSLALGWFMLIVVGKIESSLYAGTFFDELWTGIFFRFFVTEAQNYFMAAQFKFIMDFLLLIVLSGLIIAIIKRFASRITGMKKTTKHSLTDRISLLSLWLIFPLRLFAESTTSAIYSNGGFLTGSLGNAISFLPVNYMELPLWWAYSIVLFLFFVTLPFTRYMHIPAEVVYIFLKNWGVKAGEEFSGFTDLQINSCSRCGICIDSCQLNFAAEINNVQSVYFIRDTRIGKLTDENVNNCLMCGRCEESCPVNLELTVIRQQLRNKKEIAGKHYYNYTLKEENANKADVIYFAGCMTHLTPGIILSMKKIFNAAGEKFWFMDESKVVCCGRPMRQQGFVQQSKDLISKNLRMFAASGAKLLVTSCPICYKSFTEEYALDIPVMHHSEYIEHLLENKRIKIKKTDLKVVYHDSCELGRGSKIYQAPRNVLKKTANLLKLDKSIDKENAICCGGSLSNTVLELEEQLKIRDDALSKLTKNKPDMLVTSCPMCKKTFIHGNKGNVKDLAEIVADNLKTEEKTQQASRKVKEKELINE